MDKRNFSLERMLFQLGAAILFGILFWNFTEFFQPQLLWITDGGSCCERCANILYDSHQFSLALSAGTAFFWQFFIDGKVLKRILKIFLACWLSFQIYSAWTAWNVLQRNECTALYSPGPIGFVPAMIFGGVILLIESGMWASLSFLPMLLVNLLGKNSKREVQSKEY